MKKIIEQNSDGSVIGKPACSTNNYDSNDVKKLIEYYEKSANDFNNLAEFILTSQ